MHCSLQGVHSCCPLHAAYEQDYWQHSAKAPPNEALNPLCLSWARPGGATMVHMSYRDVHPPKVTLQLVPEVSPDMC